MGYNVKFLNENVHRFRFGGSWAARERRMEHEGQGIRAATGERSRGNPNPWVGWCVNPVDRFLKTCRCATSTPHLVVRRTVSTWASSWVATQIFGRDWDCPFGTGGGSTHEDDGKHHQRHVVPAGTQAPSLPTRIIRWLPLSSLPLLLFISGLAHVISCTHVSASKSWVLALGYHLLPMLTHTQIHVSRRWRRQPLIWQRLSYFHHQEFRVPGFILAVWTSLALHPEPSPKKHVLTMCVKKSVNVTFWINYRNVLSTLNCPGWWLSICWSWTLCLLASTYPPPPPAPALALAVTPSPSHPPSPSPTLSPLPLWSWLSRRPFGGLVASACIDYGSVECREALSSLDSHSL